MTSAPFTSFEAFAQALGEHPTQRSLLRPDGRLHHVLWTAQFERQELLDLLGTARAIRRLAAQPQGARFLRGTLEGKRVMHWFGQPSTRTAQSFIAAVECLGGRAQLVTDLANSSMAKGESVQDSVRVMAELFDALVIRHADAAFTQRALWGLAQGRRSIPVVSAGMGPTEHVTQSLLDLLTLQDAWEQEGGVASKSVMVVGDILRNRAARSLAFALAICGVRRICWVCPPEFAPDAALSGFLEQKGVETGVYSSLPAAIAQEGPNTDAVYMTRLQQEWDAQEGKDKRLGTSQDFVLTPQLGNKFGERCWILHPLPRVNELPEDWDQDPRLLIWQQVQNGLWARAAVLATVMGQHEAILNKS